MEAIIAIDIKTGGNILLLERLLDETSAKFHLTFDSKRIFNHYLDAISAAIGDNGERICSLGDVKECNNDSTIFQDTVYIASKLEALAKTSINSIHINHNTTDIDQLCDFYRDELSINVLPVRHNKPINVITFAVDLGHYQNRHGYGSLGMVFNVKDVPENFFYRYIIEGISPFIGDVIIDLEDLKIDGSESKLWWCAFLKEKSNVIINFKHFNPSDEEKFQQLKKVFNNFNKKLSYF